MYRPIYFSPLANIVKTDREDYSFRILGSEGKLVEVVEVNYRQTENSEGKEFVDQTINAFEKEFSSKELARIIIPEIDSGKRTPYSIWKQVKKDYSLSSSYDVSKS